MLPLYCDQADHLDSLSSPLWFDPAKLAIPSFIGTDFSNAPYPGVPGLPVSMTDT